MTNIFVPDIGIAEKLLRSVVVYCPTTLVHNGHVLHDNLRRERLTFEDLMAALRRSGVAEPREVRPAVLEDSGGVSVVPYPPDASRS